MIVVKVYVWVVNAEKIRNRLKIGLCNKSFVIHSNICYYDDQSKESGCTKFL